MHLYKLLAASAPFLCLFSLIIGCSAAPDRPVLSLYVTTTKGDLVVSNGITWPLWDPSNNPGGVTTIDDRTDRMSFQIVLQETNNPLAHGPVTAQAVNASLLGLQLSGDAQNAGNFTETPQSLQISFNCTDSGETEFQVTITPLDAEFDKISFGARKRCGGERTNIGVGTLAGLFDVVSNGVTDPSWQKNANEQFMLGPTDSSISFFIQMMQIIANDTQYLLSVSTTSSKAEVATLSTNFPKGPEGVLLNSSQPLQLVATTSNCNLVGTTQLGIALHLGSGYVPISFYFLKKCGLSKDGFDIGTSANITNDVVSNGIATLLWNPSTHSEIVTGKETETTFYASIASPHSPGVINVMTILSDNPEMCSPYFSAGGGLTIGSTLTSDPASFTVVYNCTQLGQTTITASLGLQSYFAAEWSWTKLVGGINENFQVGLSPRGSDVVTDGITSLIWSSALHQHLFVDQTNVTFYFQLSPFGSSVTPPLTVTGISFTVTPASCNPLVSTPMAFPFEVTTLQATPVSFSVNCAANGTVVIQANVQLADFSPVSFAWEQQTTSFAFFQVGSHSQPPENNNVIFNGKPTLLWDSRFHLMQISGSTYSDFWLSVNPDGGRPVSILPPKVTVTSDNLNLTVSVAQTPTANITSSSGPQLVRVAYNCSAQTLAVVVMVFDLQNGFAPISVGWTKRCGGYMEFVMVATKPKFADVVQNGLTLPLWNPSTHPFQISGTVDSTTFYLYTSEDETRLSTPEIQISATDIVNVTTTGNFSNGGVLNPVSVSVLTLSYQCIAQGSAVITVSLAFPPYEPLQWAWTKQCGQSLPDIAVGTTPKLDDVVSEGSATLMWNPVLHTAFVNGGTPQSVFWIRVASNMTRSHVVVHRINAFARNTSVCLPYVEGDLAEILNTTAVKFTVVYNCTAEGRSVIDVIVDVQDPFYAIKFSWLKRNNAGREGFQIGTTPHGSDVVYNGQATPMWDPIHYTAFFPAWIPEALLYVGMSGPGFAPQVITNVSVQTDGKDICSPVLSGALSRLSEGVSVDYQHNRTLHILFNCSAQGKTDMFITFQLLNFPPLHIGFTKFYGGHRHYFRIGTVPGFNDVIDDGYPLPMWLPGGPLNKEIVLGNTLESTFYISMSLPGEEQPYSAVQFFTTVDTPDMYNPILSGNALNGSVARYFNASSKQPIDNLTSFTVTYNCQLRGLAFIQITLLIPPFEPIAFGWRKDCGVHRHEFQIGTTINGTDVVSDGHVTYAWNRFAHVAFVFGIVQETTFHLVVHSNVSQLISNITASASSNICNPYILGSSIQPGDYVTNDTRRSNLTIVYNCASLGSTNITVVLDLGSVFDPLIFVWTKRVGGTRDYFSIGSRPGLSDVAENGIANIGWDRRFHTAFIPTNASTVTFWNFISKAAKNPWLESQVVLPAKVKTLAPGVFVRAYGIFQSGPYTLTDRPVNLTVSHECLLFGNWTIEMSLPLVAFDPVRLAWTKECPPNVVGLTVLDSTGAPVVLNGLALPQWSLSNHSVVAGTDVFNDSFTVSWNPSNDDNDDRVDASLILLELAAVVEPADFCTVILSGGLVSSYRIKREPQDLSVFFNCTQAGTMNVTIILLLDDPTRSSTAFSFSKTIGGPRAGFSISSSKENITGEDVVANGITQLSWSNIGQSGQLGAHQAGLNTNRSPFFFFMDSISTSYPYQAFAAPTWTVDPPGVCNLFTAGSAASGGVSGPISSPLELQVIYECTDVGIFNITASVQIAAFDPVEFTWTKVSNGHRLGLNVDAPAAPERGFISVVSNGAVTAPWKTSVEAVEFNQQDHNQVLFTFSSDGSQLASTQSILIQAPYVTTNSSSCLPVVSGAVANGVSIPAHEAQSLSVDLSSCLSLQTDLIVQVNFGLMPFKNVSFGFIWRRVVQNSPQQPQTDTSKTVFIGLAVGFGGLFLITVVVLVWRRFRKQESQNMLAPEYKALVVNADDIEDS